MGSRSSRLAVAGLAIVVGGLALAPAAGADLKWGSKHAFVTGKGNHLALPLPSITRHPRLVKRPSGRVRVSVKVRYRVANRRFHRGARHDRALITPTVARRLLTTGPDPSEPVYRKTIVDHRGLSKKRVSRRYKVLLPRKASRLLIKRGAFANGLRKRAQARRLVWVDVQQDRDFKQVDGTYDWREGAAAGAADGLTRRLNPSLAPEKRAGEQNPYGTLSVTNNTASGVYCQSQIDCPLVDSSTGLPGSIAGTMNSSTYAVPLALAGDAVQCFDQGTNGSNPAGFSNLDPDGNPQPYEPGSVSAATSSNDGVELPNTTGTTVTEGLAADYSLAWAGNQQTADTAGLITGTVKVGLQVISAPIKMISPGAVITGIVGIFEYFLENSCKESGNYFNVTASETSGSAVSATINAQTEEWGYYNGTGSTPYGLQLNPSSLTLQGQHLQLNTDGALITGLADNICDCSNYTGNNVIELNWNNYDPCPEGNCSATPPGSPTVTSPTGPVNCGTGNVKCPFPAAGFPVSGDSVQVFATVSGGSTGVLWKCNPTQITNCQSLDTSSGNNLTSMVYANKSMYVGISDAVLWKCDLITANDCQTLDTIGSHNGITAIAYGNGSIYVGIYTGSGINEGVLYQCDANSVNDCQTLDTPGNGIKIESLDYANNSVYVGRSDGILWKCSPTNTNDCTTLDNAGNNSINSLAYGNGTLYAGIDNGVLWSCNPNTSNACENLDVADVSISSVIYANGSVYAGLPYDEDHNTGGYVWQCSPTAVNSCTAFDGGGGEITSLLYANKSIYFGTSDGAYLEKCGATAPGSCQQLDDGSESSQSITALAAPTPSQGSG